MKLVPIHARSVFLGRPIIAPSLRARYPEVAFHLIIGGHRAQYLGRGKRAFGVHVAPPEDGLDPPHLGQSPVLVEHRSQLRVDAAFDHIRGRIPLPSALLGQGNEREQHVLAHELVEATPGLAKALMGVEALAVLDGVLLQKAIPSRAPGGVIYHPSHGRIHVFHLEQALGEIVQLLATIELGPGGRLALHLTERMEETTLDARGRPYGASRFREASGPVGHRHDGRRHLGHEGRP